MNATTDDPLDAALRAGDPARSLTCRPQHVQAAMVELLEASRATCEQHGADQVVAPLSIGAARLRRTRRMAARASALSGVLVISGACVAAAAGVIAVHTGLFGSPGMSEEDTSELYDVSSPDLAALMQDYAKDTPLAPGYSLAPLTQQLHQLGVQDSGGGRGGLMQEDGIRGAIATYSACTWERTWLTAYAEGEPATQDRATAVIAAVPTWPVVVRTAGDQGVIDAHRFAAEAARQGDAAAMRAHVETSCPAQP